MMKGYPLLKKPKIEEEEKEEEEEEPEEEGEEDNGDEMMQQQLRNEQEESLVALIEHQTNEVEHLRRRISYYKSQLGEAEKRLQDTENKLCRLQGHGLPKASRNLANGMPEVNFQRRPESPMKVNERSSPNRHQPIAQREGQKSLKSSRDNLKAAKPPACPSNRIGVSSQTQTHSRPQLVIPAVAPPIAQPIRMGDKARTVLSEQKTMDSQPSGTKRKLDQREHKDLIPSISKSASPHVVRYQTNSLLHSQHKRKLRSLSLCPSNDQLFVTSALDGVVNLWQIQGRGTGANLLSTTDCQSVKQRRWAEDVAWHPQGDKLFSVYSADGGDTQISILNLNKGKERTRVSFLEDKPHTKGIINSIMFMPWDDSPTFVTGGSDHAVVLWCEKDSEDSWKPKMLHKNNHSSAVMGVAGMTHKKIVMSAGADKRIIGVDVTTGRAEYQHQIESKCMSVLPNPCDFNLFMVQTGSKERQLKLFDLRLRQMEIHAFGWRQESSESQSALINQAWSPDGLFLTSGSADPVIHVFDIRYNSRKPSQSIKAHQKRVFKAVWHYALPLLISISSDLNIGLHKII